MSNPLNGKRLIGEHVTPSAGRDERSQVEDYNRGERKNGQTFPNASKSDHEVLAALLTRDENLREWLEITRYHDAPHRDRILNRRRAIAALDAQKAKLLAEIEAEERAAVNPTVPGLAPFAAMPPPPLPLQTPSTAESSISQVPSLRGEASPVAKTPIPQGERAASNKRPHSDTQERRQDNHSKVARIDIREPAPRVKEEVPEGSRRPQSCEFKPPWPPLFRALRRPRTPPATLR